MAAISKTVSKAGYAKLQEELEYLITVKRHVLSETFPRMLSTTRLRTSRLSLNQRSMS